MNYVNLLENFRLVEFVTRIYNPILLFWINYRVVFLFCFIIFKNYIYSQYMPYYVRYKYKIL